MQATVFRYDPTTASGSVVRDDGVELPFDASALVGTGLRLLRPGQRVRVTLSGPDTAPQVLSVQILTLSL
ncbi:MAG: hypothetical protein ACR2HA_09540 [Nocardioides sp.]